MHCPVCNTNNIQRNEMKDRFCGCCNNEKNISFNRFVQWNIGYVCWLDNSGKRDATVSEMNNRCMSIIYSCYAKVNKKINRTFQECTDYNMSPIEVSRFYASQFKGNDCI